MSDPRSQLKTKPGRRHVEHAVDGHEEGLYGDELGAGAQLGSYVVEKLRSRGGFATVYRGRHLQTGAPVALKVLHRHLVASENVLRRFENEARTVALIKHPAIVRIDEVGQLTDGRPYYAMEWLDGRDLHEHLRLKGALALDEAGSVLRALGAALAAAHSVGVVHRDLKASNVMAVPNGAGFDIKLVDFGIAKLLDLGNPQRRSELTATGVRLGTPWTMAPEQIRGRPVDPRADVYALGVLLYQLLTAQFPFSAPTAVEVEELHLHAPVPRASDLAPVPRAIDHLIARCMAKDPADRYQEVESFLADLERALRPPAPAESPAIGLYVEASVAADPEDDALLDRLDATLDAARDACADAGLVVVLESGNAILGIALLGDEPAAQRAARLRLLRTADRLARELVTDASANRRLGVKIAVQAAPVVAQRSGDSWTFAGGALLALGAWADARPAAAVTANDAALADLSADCDVEPLPGLPGVSRVRAVR